MACYEAWCLPYSCRCVLPSPQTGLHVDFAPTVLTLAGVGGSALANKALDGTPLGLVGW